MDAHSVVDDWDAAPFDGGFGGIGELKSRGFDGAVEADGTWLFLRDGEALAVVDDLDVDPRPGDIDAFEGTTGRQHEAPTAGVATVAAMLALGGEVRGTYFTDDTPLSAVDETLSGGGFTGYVELSENVLSGDYYYVYVDGAVEHVAFVGSEQLLTGEEAESRAEGEVGIYDVVAVELPCPEVPEPELPPEPEPDPTPAAAGLEAGAETESNSDSEMGSNSESESESGLETEANSESASDADPASTARTGSESSPYGGTADPDPEGDSDTEAAAETGADADADSTPEGAADAGADTDTGSESGTETKPEAGTETETKPETETEAKAKPEPSRTSDAAEAADTDLEVDTSWLERDAGDDADAAGDDEGRGDAENDDAPAGTDVEAATDESVDDDGAGGVGDPGEGDAETSEDEVAGDEAPRDDRGGAAVAAFADDSDDSDDSDGDDSDESDDSDDSDGEAEPTAPDPTVEDTPTAAPEASAESAPDRGDDARIEQYEARIEELEADLSTADSRIEELEAELESLRAERDALERRLGSTDAPAGESMSPEAALAETRLFVRQRTRGEGALSDAHDGADRETVVSNLRIEYHTTFDDAGVSVAGEPFEAWLRASDAYAFVEWLATELLFEIRAADRPEAVRPLYDALPDIDRIGFEETIAVGDGTEGREIGFDIVARDKSGHPLVVAAFDRGRDPTYADAVEPFVADATDVCAGHETLAGAVAITSSYFESDAMSVVGEATSSSLLSRSRYRSYVKLSRANGYHLCLVESREGSFNLTVPEL